MNHVDVAAVTHRGRVRDHNEDTIAVGGFLSGAVEGEPTRLTLATARPVTCLVADGLGGHAEGARASRLAASVIVDASPAFHDAEAIVAAVGSADDAVRAEAALCPQWTNMGTTVVVLTLNDGEATCVNVGDSRCYLIRDGVLVQLSSDDSPIPAGAGGTRSRLVTQSLGAGTVRPHVHTLKAVAGDRFLLCSDGMTDYVPLDDVEERLGAADDAVESLRGLLRAALDGGGGDNVSALLVTILE